MYSCLHRHLWSSTGVLRLRSVSRTKSWRNVAKKERKRTSPKNWLLNKQYLGPADNRFSLSLLLSKQWYATIVFACDAAMRVFILFAHFAESSWSRDLRDRTDWCHSRNLIRLLRGKLRLQTAYLQSLQGLWKAYSLSINWQAQDLTKYVVSLFLSFMDIVLIFSG